jgi:hypothetical protein
VDRIAIGPKGLKEEAALVTEQFRLNDQYFGDLSAEDIHPRPAGKDDLLALLLEWYESCGLKAESQG